MMKRRNFLLAGLGGAAALTSAQTLAQDPLARALLHYIQELERAERQAGYLGPRIHIPQAQKVTDGVYTVVGSMIWHNPSNYGLNNNLSFLVFEDGVFVFNGSANPALSQALHRQIQQVTDKPVKWVAVENHQGHAHLGSSYWYDMGVRNFYSNRQAHADFSASWDIIKDRWSRAVGHQLTAPAYDISDEFTVFDERMDVDVGGGEVVQMHYFGKGHTPGSTSLYIPSRNVVFPGDNAYESRMLALFSYTDTQAWVKTFERFMDFTPEGTIVVPGHGVPTDMATVKRDTYDYLKWMHEKVQAVIEQGGSLRDAENIDQSQFSHREVYAQTYAGNARHIYRELKGLDLGSAVD
ncbi:MBL fold metallo-hydrolase [Thiomicrospira sp. R3]|uniref:MBL fold metallo-hydrolase n=1 Tax=Thiomicrospira sp. R3 TaxID=3035472 RepID=UPI00259B7625|nr:MBL fold metallo-hydrolase [Thiomicrospira sp. R3]WFE67747.1 MBL fold metallo-hydrolase [Thiomicrospira sp. R3]